MRVEFSPQAPKALCSVASTGEENEEKKMVTKHRYLCALRWHSFPVILCLPFSVTDLKEPGMLQSRI